MDVASLIEATAAGRVLVVGSLPPEGRDWDLLVGDRDRGALEAALDAAGFIPAAARWLRPSDGGPEVVELMRPSDWRLSEPEAERLMADAAPLDGCARLSVPAPADRLLILARKLPRTPGFLEPKHRSRIRAALSEDPDAFPRARERARAWDLTRDLRRLEARYARGWRIPRAPSSYLPRRRRGAIVAFSGLDGSGKSTQAHVLRASLAALGYEAEVIWAPIGENAALRRFASVVKRAASRLPVGPLAGASGEAVEAHLLSRTGPGAPDFGVTRKLAAGAWSTFTTLANGISLRRAARGTRTAGRIAIYDRYVLDTVVDLRFRYAPDSRLRLQEALVRALAPTPDRAYLLDASPELAHRRKPDWSLDQTRVRAALYRREHAALGARSLDAALTVDEMAREILRDVLGALG